MVFCLFVLKYFEEIFFFFFFKVSSQDSTCIREAAAGRGCCFVIEARSRAAFKTVTNTRRLLWEVEARVNCLALCGHTTQSRDGLGILRS